MQKRCFHLSLRYQLVIAFSLLTQVLLRGDVLEWEQVHYDQPPLNSYGEDLDAVAFGKGVYVATGDRIFVSTNTVDWVDTGFTPRPALIRVIFAAGKFVAVGGAFVREGDDGNSVIAISEDGFHWSAVLHERLRTAPNSQNITNLFLSDVTYGPDGFLAVGNGSGKAVYRSPDGINWTQIPSDTMVYCNAVTYAAGRYVIAGGRILTSSNGIDWQDTTPPNAVEFEAGSVAYYGGRYFVGGWNSTGIWESADAATWTRAPFSDRNFHGIYGGLGEVVAAGGGSIAQRTGITAWDNCTMQPHWEPASVTFGGGFFISVGHGNLILRAKATASVSLSLPNPGFPMATTLNLTAKPGLEVVVEESNDLKTWVGSTNLVTASSEASFSANGSGNGQKFYRAVAK